MTNPMHTSSRTTASRWQSTTESTEWATVFSESIENFPASAVRCRKLYFYLNGKNVSLEGATELIASDPLLAVEVIRSAKSAIYGYRGANSLEDALQAIGLERLGRIALRLWLRNLMPKSLPTYCLDSGVFVRRSMACGAAMRHMYQGDTDLSQTAYSIGLLHAIGRVVIDEGVRSRGETELIFQERNSRRFAEVERFELGTTHAEVGGLALKKWGFSKDVYLPIASQFSSSESEDVQEWNQSLAIARFTADRVMEALDGVADPLKGEGRAVYRGKNLFELFEYTLAIVEDEVSTQLN